MIDLTFRDLEIVIDSLADARSVDCSAVIQTERSREAIEYFTWFELKKEWQFSVFPVIGCSHARFNFMVLCVFFLVLLIHDLRVGFIYNDKLRSDFNNFC